MGVDRTRLDRVAGGSYALYVWLQPAPLRAASLVSQVRHYLGVILAIFLRVAGGEVL